MILEIAIAIGVVLVFGALFENSSQPATSLPRVGANPGPFRLRTWWARWKWYQSGHEKVRRAYENAKDTNYVTQTLLGDTIVLGPKFLKELNMRPESELSSTAALVDSVLGQHNGVDLLLQDHLTSDICRGSLTRNLPLFLPRMADELHAALAGRLGQDTGPTVCVAHDFLYSLVHRISSLVFVGRAYCYDPVWRSAVSDLPIHVEITKFILLPFPTFFRPFIARLIPQRYSIFRQRAAVADLLFRSPDKSRDKSEPSVMRLFLESGKDGDPNRIAARLLLLTAAALHTSSMAASHALFDLCVMPEYIEPLRREAEEALAQTNGEWEFSTIKRLPQLDSFLKESQRLNQSTFLGFDRKVISPIKLSDGKTTLPRGVTITIPGGPMARDPMFYDEPDKFKGLRFYHPDEDVASSTNSHRSYTGIEPGNLSWGNGRFTCPGRWYAAAMIKLVVANLLLDYDISLYPHQTERPANTKYDTEVLPDFAQKIAFRRRQRD